MAYRIVVHSSALDCLRAIGSVAMADSARTNYLVGFIFERWLRASATPVQAEAEETESKPDKKAEIMITVWAGQDLRLMFSKLGSAQCKLVSPLAPSALVKLARPLIPQLAAHLLTLSPFLSAPELLRSIAGPKVLIDAFLSCWPHPRKASPSMEMYPCSATSAPPTVDLPLNHSISRVQDIHQIPREDLEALAYLLIGFFAGAETAPRLDLEQAIKHWRKFVQAGALWVYRAPPVSTPVSNATSTIPVGFVTTGRPTLRTVAIRGVFVAASHRQQGIAERMTACVSRAHLIDVPRLDLDYARQPAEMLIEPATKWGGKEEVCLFVEPSNPTARRVYERVGFEVEEERWCDWDLEGIEPGHR
ncbi:hypothetical protein JCM11641_000531 [Rhodosporidiobolus odoratus]